MKKILAKNGEEILVDDSWYEVLSKRKWHITAGYAATTVGKGKNRKDVYMHRYIMMAPDGILVDHINQNKLDNRIENLRFVTKSENAWNSKAHSDSTVPLKGVCYDKNRKKYLATICKNGHTYHIGRFNTAEEASKAYDSAATKLFGEYASVNNLGEKNEY